MTSLFRKLLLLLTLQLGVMPVYCPTNNWTQETACSRARLGLELVAATVVSEPRL